MKIVPMVVAISEKDRERIEAAASVVQELEHLYDEIGDTENMNKMGDALDLLLAIINNEQSLA